jgi:RNA polymerase sigma factor (sigma-70 family)
LIPAILDPTISAFPVSTVCVTDGDLVARARDGDHAAFGELVDRHRVAVYRASMAALGSHAEAEDAAQDTFVVAWRRLDSFRGEASFRTWLLTIAWHQAINRRRSLVKWWRRTVPLDETGVRLKPDTTYVGGPTKAGGSYRGGTHTGAAGTSGVADAYTSAAESASVVSGFSRTVGRNPEQVALGGELRRDIQAAIRALTPTLRDALLLAQSGDYSYEEIGGIVRAPVGTIKWRVAEARRRVKQQLRKLGHGELG